MKLHAEHVARVIDAYLFNPFLVSPEERAVADEIVDRVGAHTLLGWLVAESDRSRLRRLTLSLGHRLAMRSPDDPKPVDDLVGTLAARLPGDPTGYVRVAMAAGRCYRALMAFVGSSEAVRELRGAVWAACFGRSLRHALQLERVIRDHDVLVLGESGTGKELIGRALQAGHPGPKDGSVAPAATLNAAAIPETLVESALFGHTKGAFTGASRDRLGRIRSASGGCLFLDEIGDLPATTQVKLLRVIETNEVTPLGSDEPARVEVRYVAATHKDLEAMADGGAFRRDLFERLAGNIVRCPPLRDRPGDIVELGEAFIAPYLQDAPDDGAAESIRDWLTSSTARNHDWPGNVRELQNRLRDLLLGLSAELRPGSGARPTSAADAMPGLPAPIREGTATLRFVEDWYIRRVFDDHEKNYSRAARALGIDRTKVKRRL